jgi:hypothetical protein
MSSAGQNTLRTSLGAGLAIESSRTEHILLTVHPLLVMHSEAALAGLQIYFYMIPTIQSESSGSLGNQNSVGEDLMFAGLLIECGLGIVIDITKDPCGCYHIIRPLLVSRERMKRHSMGQKRDNS